MNKIKHDNITEAKKEIFQKYGAYIELPIRDGLDRDWDEGEVLEIIDQRCNNGLGKKFNMKLVENALKGDKKIKGYSRRST